jgi:transcription-repair coupling factor (superfamily II helicase)
MALSGIRDMSLMEEAPADRYPVQTYVLEHNYDILADVIRREIARGGQVFYLHNHIESIDQVAGRLQKLLPDAAIAVAHGRMGENDISSVMNDMLNGTIQVLVCTTIIETGIDLPNVNTLIIDNADRLGLAQLHQIRGRVGRSSRRAFAYLTYRPDRILSEIASKRLSAIREFAEFGAGFKIALRDLEIRGTGNLLGAEQSGHMSNVGYDMYLKLLEEAIREEKGEEPREAISCSADFTVDAHIPDRYIPSSSERVDIYRRIAAIASGEPADDVLDELIDRYGDPPAEVLNLIEIAGLRLRAANIGMTDITQKGDQLNLTFARPPLEVISRLYSLTRYKGRLMLNAGNHPYLGFRLKNEEPLDAAKELIRSLETYSEKPEVVG